MKKLVVIILCLCGCKYESSTTREYIRDDSGSSTGLRLLTFEGHQYLYYAQGSIIHSESCTNHIIK